MKLSTREDIEAPIARVFQALTDFDYWERAAMRRGADILRLTTATDPAPGMQWQVGFSYRGRPRKVTVHLDSLVPATAMAFSGLSPSIEGELQIDLVEMSPHRTRMALALEMRPRTLAARLFLQSLKLAKGRIDKRFKTRAADLAALIETRSHRKTQG